MKIKRLEVKEIPFPPSESSREDLDGLFILLQIAFVCLVYPALVLSYAGQAAFISKNLIPHDDEVVCATHDASSEYFHLRESVPNRK